MRGSDGHSGTPTTVWIAIVISLISAGFSGYGLYESRKRTIAQDTPRVKFEQNTDTDDPIVGLRIVNLGSAIARLRNFTYYVDKKPITDADDVIDAGKLEDVGYYQFDDDDTLAIGEGEWVLQKSTKKRGQQKSIDHFIDFLDNHMDVKAEVCSITTDKCEEVCFAEEQCQSLPDVTPHPNHD